MYIFSSLVCLVGIITTWSTKIFQGQLIVADIPKLVFQYYYFFGHTLF